MPKRHGPAYLFLVAVGGRPVLKGFPPNFCAGPFYLDVAWANGSATAVDLTAADAWYADAQVRAAFNPANGGTAKQNFTVSIESLFCLITDGAFQILIGTTKDNLWLTGYPSIRAIVGSVTKKYPLDGSFQEAIESTHAAATSSPATGAGSKIRGRPFVLPSPIRVDCAQDSLDAITEADVALGAATTSKLVLGPGSIVIPNNEEGAGSDVQTDSCRADDDPIQSPKEAADARGRYLGQVVATIR